jgi:tetratricopeptide (TPR) repeat protein
MRRLLSPLIVAACLAPTATPAFALTATEARSLSFKLQSEGMRLYREGKSREATQVFQQVVNINLNSFLAFYYLGLSLSAERRYGEAIEPLKIALDLQPDYVQAHLALGDAYLKGGDVAESRAEYLRALELQPHYAPAINGLGRLAESEGRDDEAETQYRKALEINVTFADAYTNLGELFLRRDRLDDATELFMKAIAVRPDFASAYTRLGIAFSRQKRYDDAIAATRKSLSLTPNDPEPHVALARISLDLGSLARADEEIQEALALDPDNALAHIVLAGLKQAQEDFSGAVQVVQELHERGVAEPLMKRRVADALRRLKSDAARYAPLRAAADRQPPRAGDVAALARFVEQAGAHLKAADLFLAAAALSTDPAIAAGLQLEAGVALCRVRLHARAIDLFEAVAADATIGGPDGPLRATALFDLGVARAALRLDAPAAESFRSYLTLIPDDSLAKLYLANALYRLGRKDEARAAYSAYLEADASRPDAEQIERILRLLGS